MFRALVLMLAMAIGVHGPAPALAAPKMTPWQFVCEVRQVDCSDIPPPLPVFIPMDAWGWYDAIHNPNVIFINVDLAEMNPVQAQVVWVHEMNHYLDYQTGRLGLYGPDLHEYDLTELCMSEATAFEVSNAWVAYTGLDQRYAWYEWLSSYPHCLNPQ